MSSLPPSSLSRWLPALALVVLTCTWGYTWVLLKQALVHAAPFALAAQRCVGGALALLVAVKLMGKSMRLVAPGETLVLGLVQITGFVVLQTWALVEGGSGKTAVLIFTMPIWTLLMAWPILGERVRGRQWLAAGSTLAGLLLIIAPWDMHASLFSKLLGLGAAMCWAISTILIKRLRSRQPVDLLVLTTWQMIIGSVPLVGLALLMPERPTDWSSHYLMLIGFLSVISVALCWWLWVWILDRVPAWEASLSVLGTPVVAILSSRMTLGEEFKTSEIAGILLIGGGLLLLSLFGWLSARRAAARLEA
jgi:drug/metabolite transporter (DMT)-like permease